MKKSRLKIIISILILLLIATASFGYVVLRNRYDYVETVISDLPTKMERSLDDSLSLNVKVSPLKGRKIWLQRFDSDKDKWKTVQKFKSGDNIEIDKEKREKTTSLWRLYVPKGKSANEVTSNTMTLTTSNIEKISLAADTACIYRVDGQGEGTMIYEKDPDEKRAQASTTKLMTAILMIENGKYDENTIISENAAHTKEIYNELKAGDEYSYKDLLYAMMLPSANDAAVAIAEGISGDEGTFVDMMNERAKELGMNDTHYINSHGLDADGHYSTARDVALLTAYAYTFPEIRKSWKFKKKRITGLRTGNTWKLKSTDKIIGYNDNFKGGKTGTQPVAGRCFAGVYKYGGKTYVTVVLGCETESERWDDTKSLHRYIEAYADSKY